MQLSVLNRSLSHAASTARRPCPASVAHRKNTPVASSGQVVPTGPAGLAVLRERHAPSRRRAVQARLFDGLKNLIPGGLGGSSKSQPQVQPEEEEEEEEEGAEMVRLDTESGGLAQDQGVFGPLAVLLVGFQAAEVESFRAFMLDMEADMVKPPLGTRRTVFLSGMVGAEVVEVIAAYKDAGMPPTVWAAAVPNNYGRIVKELVAEVHADNAAMVRKAQEAQARKAMEEQGQA
ncbi:hypothetical protein GPECTOR_47g329 [Gonium pectorale]|uniref:DUF3783 domain-containing protein n=1 Tax=Gonium pectorale TaxID=33097 RepID=A0A150G894_GONPE|nr:hypothetical protein GPECTOR_47g329 [Gonium pectorale]|eukprot:KXZ46054.1 hypothetical protein GPECTOR_47g329 [Gonium pectorale]